MLGSSFIANFRLTINGPRGVITCSMGSPGVTTWWSYPLKVENNTFPIPLIMRFFPENEGNFWGNQLPDGSISLSPLCRRRTICPKRAFARDSPDFAFFKHFPRFFRALLLHKPLSRSRSVASVHVCMRVCGCVLCMLCAVFYHKTRSNHGRKVVRKCKKHHGKQWENSQNMNSVFGTLWPSMDRKKVRKRSYFPTHCFYTSPGICRRFWPEVLTQTPKNAVFRPRS